MKSFLFFIALWFISSVFPVKFVLEYADESEARAYSAAITNTIADWEAKFIRKNRANESFTAEKKALIYDAFVKEFREVSPSPEDYKYDNIRVITKSWRKVIYQMPVTSRKIPYFLSHPEALAGLVFPEDGDVYIRTAELEKATDRRYAGSAIALIVIVTFGVSVCLTTWVVTHFRKRQAKPDPAELWRLPKEADNLSDFPKMEFDPATEVEAKRLSEATAKRKPRLRITALIDKNIPKPVDSEILERIEARQSGTVTEPKKGRERTEFTYTIIGLCGHHVAL